MAQKIMQTPLKVAVIGSGNWGSVISKIVSLNVLKSPMFDNNVSVWVYEEYIQGKKLTSIINEDHENVKYLPGIKLPTNLTAIPSLIETVTGRDLLIFVLPHQFLMRTCRQIADSEILSKNARAISLIKGIHLSDENKPVVSSQIISSTLGIECCALSGANVAKDIAKEEFSEATIGYKDIHSVTIWQQLFDTPYFKINAVPDVCGVEVCGAIKNVVALAAGFCDGLNLGSNAKAAIIRLGFQELRTFAILFFDGVLEDTFFDSAGIADTITTCYGGRNVKCAQEFVKCKGTKSWDSIEAEFLGGQKLQGTLCCIDVYQTIKHYKLETQFPLFIATYQIAFEGASAMNIINIYENEHLRAIKKKDDCAVCTFPNSIRDLKKEFIIARL